jgi:hypothetical protein
MRKEDIELAKRVFLKLGVHPTESQLFNRTKCLMAQAQITERKLLFWGCRGLREGVKLVQYN